MNAQHTVLLATETIDLTLLKPPHVPESVHVIYQPANEADDIDDHLWRDVEILVTQRAFPTPEQAPALRWIQLQSAGVNHALEQPIAQPPRRLTSASGVHAVPIAEYVIATVLSMLHRIPLMVAWQQQRHWPNKEEAPRLMPRELWGMTIGIVGYGSIGRHTARLARAHGMRVLAMQRADRRRDPGFVFPGVGDPDGTLPAQYFSHEHLHDLLSQSDVVLASVPLTPATTRMFDASAFAAMKPDALFVNIARGQICDQPALIAALSNGTIGGAVLDVFDQEPLPAESPLWLLPNVLISPHMSGSNPHYATRLTEIVVENLGRYLRGEPLLNEVDLSQGY